MKRTLEAEPESLPLKQALNPLYAFANLASTATQMGCVLVQEKNKQRCSQLNEPERALFQEFRKDLKHLIELKRGWPLCSLFLTGARCA
jgi:hypothetical protein